MKREALTTFKELQVSVFVMQELNVVISWGVGMLLFLSVRTDNNNDRLVWSQLL